jgi:hypothetical protein
LYQTRAFMKGPSLGMNSPDRHGALFCQTSKSCANDSRLLRWYCAPVMRSGWVITALLLGERTIRLCQT